MSGEGFDAAILLAHGARDERWKQPFARLLDELSAKLAPRRVALAYLEFSPPTLSDAVREVRGAGARRVLVVPVFLSGGGHVMKDVPPLVAAECDAHPDLEFELAGAIGEEPEVSDGIARAVARLARG